MQFSFVVDSRSDFAVRFLFGGMSDDLIRLGIASRSQYVIIRDNDFVDETVKSRAKAEAKKKALLTVPAPPSARISRRIL